MPNVRAAILIPKRTQDQVFDSTMIDQIRSMVDLRIHEGEKTPTVDEAASLLDGAELAICSWGSPRFDEELLGRAPVLRHIVYAAGSVKPIVTEAVVERGISVTTGAGNIAENVAENAVGLIISGMRNIWRLGQETKAGKWRNTVERDRVKSLYDSTVGIVGGGYVGQALLRLLKAFPGGRLLFDPTLDAERMRELGATKASLDELLAKSDVVTLHAPKLPATYHMLNRSNLPLLKQGAVLINTARGTLIDEKALLEFLKARSDVLACLDVTDPEPPAEDHPFRSLENVILTPHTAGGAGSGRRRLGGYAIDEITAYLEGRPALYPVDLSRLDQIA